LVLDDFAKSLDAVGREGGDLNSIDIVDLQLSVFGLELVSQVP
jgi:hypothetical protein